VTESELVDHCRQGLPSFERPRRVLIVDSYPVTATGKIRRVELRQQAAALLAESQAAV
jgi:acyl-CoA synthetase (AMP-forming)/AMP-acid ligase II